MDVVIFSLAEFIVEQAVNIKINPINKNRFMFALLDDPIVKKLAYESLTMK